MLFPSKNIKYSDYLLLFELLSWDVNNLNFSIFDKECVKSKLGDCAHSSFKLVSKIFDKNLPDEEINALKNLIESKDLSKQKPDKDNTIVILNKNDYVLRFNRIPDNN